MEPGNKSSNSVTAPSNPQEVVRWLVSRQTDLLDPDGALDSEFIGTVPKQRNQSRDQDQLKANDDQPLHQSPDKSLFTPGFGFDEDCVGMNGRTNKVADTCYAWWAGASLHMLGCPNLYSHSAVQEYLLEKTQHPVLGGFGKFPGNLPDLYHSCLGLAALSLAGSSEVKEVDASMCISKEAQARLQKTWDSWELPAAV